MNMLKEVLSLHPAYSARFSNHLLRTLIELEEKDRNIDFSPARLQAVMVILVNWAVPHIQEGILERVGKFCNTKISEFFDMTKSRETLCCSCT